MNRTFRTPPPAMIILSCCRVIFNVLYIVLNVTKKSYSYHMIDSLFLPHNAKCKASKQQGLNSKDLWPGIKPWLPYLIADTRTSYPQSLLYLLALYRTLTALPHSWHSILLSTKFATKGNISHKICFEKVLLKKCTVVNH